jgi:hypothetical protein
MTPHELYVLVDLVHRGMGMKDEQIIGHADALASKACYGALSVLDVRPPNECFQSTLAGIFDPEKHAHAPQRFELGRD